MTDMAFAIGFHDHLYFCLIMRRFDLMRLSARYAISILLAPININVIMDWKFRRLIVLITILLGIGLSIHLMSTVELVLCFFISYPY